MVKIEEQRLIYHLTAMDNLEKIIQKGLLCRNLVNGFTDVANPEIIQFRGENGLNDYVPFHFFAKNPFDGEVLKDVRNMGREFIYLAVDRTFAQKNDFRIIPMHPRHMEELQLYSYNEGMAIIDWDTMNTRAYQDYECKQICMAECVAYQKVDMKDISLIFVPNNSLKDRVDKLLRKYGMNKTIYVNENMFVRR